MCEFLIFTQTSHLSDRGDVIHIAPDGWNWSVAETLPPFAVRKYPGLDAADWQAYLAGERTDDPTRTDLRMRGWRFDLDAPVTDMPPTPLRKTPRARSDVIGRHPYVLG